MTDLAEKFQPVSPATAEALLIARLERLPISRWHVRARIIIGFATFFDAYTSLAIAYALPSLVRTWHLSPQNIGFIISVSFIGQLAGALYFGWLAERRGRLQVAMMTVAIYAVMSVACVFAWNPLSLIVFRLIQGVGLGGEVPVAGAYINEFASAKRRGRFFVLYELLFPLGIAAAGLFGYWLVPVFGWRVMFVIGAIPAVLVLAGRRMLPESPRWLATHGRLAEADAVVTMIENDIERRGVRLPPPAPLNFTAAARPAETSWRDLFRGIYLRRTLTVWLLWICAYLISNGLQTWLPSIYTTVFHLPLSTALLYSFTSSGIGLIASLLCAFLIDPVGRRRWYSFSFLVSAVPLAVLWALGATGPIQVLVLGIAGNFFLSTISMSLYLYTAELYPTRMRAFGTSVATSWLRLASAVSPAIVGYILAGEGLRWVFLYFSVIAVIGGGICLSLMVETRERVLEELSP